MRILVVGATGGSGRAAVAALAQRGHTVTVLARRPSQDPPFPTGVHVVVGDATHPDDCERAVAGQDAVAVTLGIREPALRVRLFGPAATQADVRSLGTLRVIEAMRRQGVRKVVVQTSYGVGTTRDRLPLKWRAIFAAVLRPQIADTELQERIVRDSGLTWVIVQPVALTDSRDDAPAWVARDGVVPSMSVSRRQVGAFLAVALETSAYDGQVVSLSRRMT
jgi:uncharacterized protein YbjT (DUF2867 family)